jgi:hypothetical protein
VRTTFTAPTGQQLGVVATGVTAAPTGDFAAFMAAQLAAQQAQAAPAAPVDWTLNPPGGLPQQLAMLAPGWAGLAPQQREQALAMAGVSKPTGY